MVYISKSQDKSPQVSDAVARAPTLGRIDRRVADF